MSFSERYSHFIGDVLDDVYDTLEGEVAQAVRDLMSEQLDSAVYSYEASEEAMESRRYDKGGLADQSNMVATVDIDSSKSYVLTVSNEAPFQQSFLASKGKDLSDVVDQGIPGYNQPGARPFVQPTEDEAITSGRALQAFNEGMKKRGNDIQIL